MSIYHKLNLSNKHARDQPKIAKYKKSAKGSPIYIGRGQEASLDINELVKIINANKYNLIELSKNTNTITEYDIPSYLFSDNIQIIQSTTNQGPNTDQLSAQTWIDCALYDSVRNKVILRSIVKNPSVPNKKMRLVNIPNINDSNTINTSTNYWYHRSELSANPKFWLSLLNQLEGLKTLINLNN